MAGRNEGDCQATFTLPARPAWPIPGATRIKRVGKPWGSILGDRVATMRLIAAQHPLGDQAAMLHEDSGQPRRCGFH